MSNQSTFLAIVKTFSNGIIIDDLKRGKIVYSGNDRIEAEKSIPMGSSGNVVEVINGKWYYTTSENCINRTFEKHLLAY